jgi:hypothetical protein
VPPWRLPKEDPCRPQRGGLKTPAHNSEDPASNPEDPGQQS